MLSGFQPACSHPNPVPSLGTDKGTIQRGHMQLGAISAMQSLFHGTVYNHTQQVVKIQIFQACILNKTSNFSYHMGWGKKRRKKEKAQIQTSEVI